MVEYLKLCFTLTVTQIIGLVITSFLPEDMLMFGILIMFVANFVFLYCNVDINYDEDEEE